MYVPQTVYRVPTTISIATCNSWKFQELYVCSFTCYDSQVLNMNPISMKTTLGPEGVRYSEKFGILKSSYFPMGNRHLQSYHRAKRRVSRIVHDRLLKVVNFAGNL